MNFVNDSTVEMRKVLFPESQETLQFREQAACQTKVYSISSNDQGGTRGGGLGAKYSRHLVNSKLGRKSV